MITAHVDLDAFKYAVASVGEERSILVVHKKSGWEREFKTRTDFWGHHAKKAGGWLSALNAKKVAKGQEPALPEDFEILDQQRLKDEPVSHILNSVKQSVNSAVRASGAEKVCYYIGKGDSFRVEYSTLLEYKGSRKNLQKPLLLDEVVEYMIKKFSPEIITSLEVDDKVVMETYRQVDNIILGEDKDYCGSGGAFFNFNHPEWGIIDTDCFGKLYLDEKGKVRGYGRIFKLLQCCSEDSSDDYAANCFSEVRWAEKSAFKVLKDCRNDKEAFQAAVGIFKKLYPEPKIITGWRGDEFEINWFYTMNECLNLCHLHRWDNDFLNLKEILDSLGVDYA
jgi:hypothetical protein